MQSQSQSQTQNTRPLFSTVSARNSSAFPKRAAPSSFVSSISRQQQSKPVNESLLLPLECAFFLPFEESISIDRYFIAVGELLGGQFQKIVYGGKNGNKIVMHLCSQSTLDTLIAENDAVLIDEHRLPIRKLVDPGLSLYLQNVAPHVPNEILTEELKKHVRLLSDIKLTTYGMKDPRLRHILAYKRQVQIPTDDKDKVPISITVSWKNIPYAIYLTFDSPRCYNCGKEGHLIKDCPDPPRAPAQKRLDEIKLSPSTSSPTQDVLPTLPPDDVETMEDEDDLTYIPESSLPAPVVNETLPSAKESVSITPPTPAPVAPKTDFFPNFSPQRSSSLSSLDNKSLTDIEFPSLKPPEPSAKKRKEDPDAPSNIEKKTKFNTSARDPELTKGFKCMVEKLIQNESGISICAEDVCDLLNKLKNSQKKQEIIDESDLPVHEIKRIFLLIHGSPDTPANMKSRITRLMKSLFADSKMILKNVDNVNNPSE